MPQWLKSFLCRSHQHSNEYSTLNNVRVLVQDGCILKLAQVFFRVRRAIVFPKLWGTKIDKEFSSTISSTKGVGFLRTLYDTSWLSSCSSQMKQRTVQAVARYLAHQYSSWFSLFPCWWVAVGVMIGWPSRCPVLRHLPLLPTQSWPVGHMSKLWGPLLKRRSKRKLSATASSTSSLKVPIDDANDVTGDQPAFAESSDRWDDSLDHNKMILFKIKWVRGRWCSNNTPSMHKSDSRRRKESGM